MPIPECNVRRDLDPQAGHYVCLHPRVHAPAQRVSTAICQICSHATTESIPLREFPKMELGMALATLGFSVRRDGTCFHLGELLREEQCETCSGNVRIKHYRCEHPVHEETTIAYCQQCLDYEPKLKQGAIRQWAVGVVTAPRETPTLERTLASLNKAGWTDPWLFVEPGSTLPESARSLRQSVRHERLGLWPNWYLGLAELVMRFPIADAYFMCEDDVVFCQGARTHLEATLWPLEKLGVASLFCAGAYRRDARGWFEVHEGWEFAGAQALVLPPQAARLLLGHPLVINHRRRGSNKGLKGTDSVIGLWANLSNLPTLVHSPSLVQHIGDISTIEHGPAEGAYRSAWDFPGEDTTL